MLAHSSYRFLRIKDVNVYGHCMNICICGIGTHVRIISCSLLQKCRQGGQVTKLQLTGPSSSSWSSVSVTTAFAPQIRNTVSVNFSFDECIVDDMKRVKPTRCSTVVYWTLWIAQHVSGITIPIVRSLRLYKWPQRMAPHLSYGRLLVWCMAVGFWSVRLEGHVERFIRSNKPLCSIELVLLSSCHRRCTVKHSSKKMLNVQSTIVP